jgi:hypothetical protein
MCESGAKRQTHAQHLFEMIRQFQIGKASLFNLQEKRRREALRSDLPLNHVRTICVIGLKGDCFGAPFLGTDVKPPRNDMFE